MKNKNFQLKLIRNNFYQDLNEDRIFNIQILIKISL